MRQTFAGLIAGAALAATVAASPAQACAVSDPCSPYYRSYSSSYHHHAHRHGHVHAYGYGCGGYGGCGARERLPDPTGPIVHGGGPQYYYVNQGPTYSGPGNFAPVPTYQERAVTGWQSYSRPYYYGYNGGPYANTTNHYYDGAAAVQGPVVTSYRFARRHYHRGHRHAHYRAYHAAPRHYHVHRHHGHYGKPLRSRY